MRCSRSWSPSPAVSFRTARWLLGAHTRSSRRRREPAGASLVRFARRYLGVRYVYGGVSPRTGFDCSGFTRFVYAHFGITLPHLAAAQFALGRSVSRDGAPARRPRLLRRARPRRALPRRRHVHPRAAHRRAGRDQLAERLVLDPVRRRAPPRRRKRLPAYHGTCPEPPVSGLRHGPPSSSSRLYSLVERLRAEDRLREFAAALPARARVSEPALALLLAALHDEARARPARAARRGRRRARRGRGRGLVHRRRARRPLPEPRRPPRLRPRAAAASRRRAAPGARGARCRRSRLRLRGRARRGDRARVAAAGAAPHRAGRRAGDRRAWSSIWRSPATSASSASRSAGTSPCAAGSSTSSPRPAASRSGSSCSATRSSRSAPSRRSPSARCDGSTRRRSIPPPSGGATRSRSTSARRRTTTLRSSSRTISCRRSTACRISSGSPTRSMRSGRRRATPPLSLDGAAELSPLPQGQPFSFDAQRPALAARGLSEAEHELGGLLRQGLDVVVSFPHRGEALRQQQLLRRSEATILEEGDGPGGADVCRLAGPARLRLARSRARAAAGHAGVPQAGLARDGRAGPRAAELLGSPHRRLRRARGPRHRPAPELRDEGGRRASRATTCCSRSAATTASTSRTSRSARSAATSGPTRRARRSRSSAARRGTT